MVTSLKALLGAEGRGIRTTWLHSASPLSAEMVARLGWDCMVADMQHSMTGFGEMIHVLQATTNLGATVFVRPPALDAGLIGRLLVCGASGIICPMVNTASEAETLVAACRYPLRGVRSFGPIRARLLFGNDYVDTANRDVLAFAMIETTSGLANLDAIARVPGLDGVFAGPSDVASSLGRPPRVDTDDPTVLDALTHITAGANSANIAAGLVCDTAI